MALRVPRSAALALLLLFLAAPALAHKERPVVFPDGSGAVPAYRTEGPYLVVCKNDTRERIAALPAESRARNERLLAECRFEHIQAAVDAVNRSGTRILVLPGLYREEPGLAPPAGPCAAIAERIWAGIPSGVMGGAGALFAAWTAPPTGVMTYEEQVLCPRLQNLVAVLGDDPADPGIKCGDSPREVLCNLQIEGTGARPEDVIVDAQFQKLNAIRADRADGFYVRNLVVQKTTFNGIYILEQDGFVIDRAVGRWNDEYGFLTFDVDHGLYTDCEAYGNGDSGIYPGSASDLRGTRASVEITRCDAHHNTLGYSGTSGNSVYAHGNKFHHNAAGVSTDSLFPDHPGMPQDSATFRDNEIFSNNENYYDNFLGPDPPCAKPIAERDWSGFGTVCPVVPLPVGTGIVIAGGNNNTVEGNHIYDNWRYGTVLFSVPAPARNEWGPGQFFDTSHLNRHRNNRMGVDPAGSAKPNGLDFWWDGGGAGNCWAGNRGPRGITSDPPWLPECDGPSWPRLPGALKMLSIFFCGAYNRTSQHHPWGCSWMESPVKPK
ncbi:MAG: right-handed parallel beta-helix repeat-containing protein [Halobacteria archaeon]